MKKQTDLLSEVVEEIAFFLTACGFKRRGRWCFVRNCPEDYGRQERLTFISGASQKAFEAIEIGVLVGIYYPAVREAEKLFVDDDLSGDPLIAGSISQFSGRDKFISFSYQAGQDKEILIAEIIEEIRIGAFTLLYIFPNLESMIMGIRNKQPFLYQYHGFNTPRHQVTVASMILVSAGLIKAQRWIIDHAPTNSFLKAFSEGLFDPK